MNSSSRSSPPAPACPGSCVPCHHRGLVPKVSGIRQLVADHLIHAWDLARAIGADEHLDEKLVTSCAGWFEAVEEAYRSAGAIAERPPVPGHADAQTLLLARFGRRA